MIRGLLILTGAALAACLAAESAELRLRAEAETSDQLVRLQDIATMDPAVLARWGELVMAVAPQPGRSEVFSRAEISDKLRGLGVNGVRIGGAAAVRVSRTGGTCTPEMQEKLIREYLSGHSPWGPDLEIEILSKRDIVVPESDFSWRIEATRSRDFLGTVLFSLKTVHHGRESAAHWISARLRVRREVAVANRSLAKGETINESAIRWEKREITPFISDALLDSRELLGRRTGRIVTANSVLTSACLERQWLVRRGEPATLKTGSDVFSISLQVMPLTDGVMGQRLRVMNESSRKIIMARVSGVNLLEVDRQ